MQTYQPDKTLVFVHTPKTGGTAVGQVLRSWFGERFHHHFFDQTLGRRPERVDLKRLEQEGRPPMIYGHFNAERGLGLPEYYPDVRQLLTVLRDPLEAAISSYHFLTRKSADWVDKSRVPTGSLDEYIASVQSNMLHHFPCEVTRDNFQQVINDNYIDIGITESLDESLLRIASRLGLAFNPASLPRLNVGGINDRPSHAAVDRFRERHFLEYEVYKFVSEELN